MVGIVTQAALREMRFPGLLCVVTPIVVGVTFRFVGKSSDRALLGAEVLVSKCLPKIMEPWLDGLWFQS